MNTVRENINRMTYPSIYIAEFYEPMERYRKDQITLDEALEEIESAIMFKMIE